MNSQKIQNQKLNYFQCPRGGYHDGQILNIICVEPGCQNKLLCCNVCSSEDHKKHSTKSLKLFLNESRATIEGSHKVEINLDAIMEMIQSDKIKTLDKLKEQKNNVIGFFDSAIKDLQSYYKQIGAKLKVLTSSSITQIMIEIYGQIFKKNTAQQLMRQIQRILSYLPKNNAKQPQSEIKQQNLRASLQSSYSQIQQSIAKIIIQNKNMFKVLKSKLNSTDLFAQKNFKFSQTYKHNNISIINPTTVKSTGASGYKFCTLDPDLGTTGVKTYSYKIKQSSSSNWLAVGMCHRQIIAKNAYDFKYSNLGHGAYMISSNAGTWSNIDTNKNNLVKAFYFYKNDVIIIKVDFNIKKIYFFKKNSDSSYELEFTLMQDDALYPCVLFYYENDEIEYVQDTEMIDE